MKKYLLSQIFMLLSFGLLGQACDSVFKRDSIDYTSGDIVDRYVTPPTPKMGYKKFKIFLIIDLKKEDITKKLLNTTGYVTIWNMINTNGYPECFKLIKGVDPVIDSLCLAKAKSITYYPATQSSLKENKLKPVYSGFNLLFKIIN